MKKLKFLIFIFMYAVCIKAQTDSLKKYRLSGFVIETHGIIMFNTENSSQPQFQTYVKNNELLNKDLTGYTTGNGGYTNSFNGLFSARIFFELQKVKRFNLEAFIGLRAGTSQLAGSSYFKDYSDTTGTYINPSTNKVLFEIDNYNSSYHYQIESKRVFMPVGMNVSTNKKRRFWFSAGLELSPGISFDNTFYAFYNLSKNTTISDPALIGSNTNYSRSRTQTVDSRYDSNKLKGTAFEMYAVLPFSMNIRFSKKIKILKQLNLNTSFAPGMYYTKNRFIATQSNFIINCSLGLRYNW